MTVSVPIQDIYVTDCGVRLGLSDGYVMPLTTCCSLPATHVGTCSGCWGYARGDLSLCALMGHRAFEVDLRKMVTSLGACADPNECVAATARHFTEVLDRHTHGGVGSQT